MNLQDAVMGTDTPRDLLLAAGVQAFRLQAGYVAPVMTGEGVLPMVDFLGTGEFPAWGGIGIRIGTVHYVQILMKCCSHCRFHIGKFLLDDTAYVYTRTDVTHCEICGDKAQP